MVILSWPVIRSLPILGTTRRANIQQYEAIYNIKLHVTHLCVYTDEIMACHTENVSEHSKTSLVN